MTTIDVHESEFADYCWTHQRREPDRSTDFRVCGECGHVFRSATELLTATQRMDRECYITQEDRTIDTCYSCPHCMHDFV